MRKRNDLPIILSHNTHTGLCLFRNMKMGGYDLLIVGLNHEVESGADFDFKDIDWVKTVLHFGDIESMEVTAKTLSKAVKDWKKKETPNESGT